MFGFSFGELLVLLVIGIVVVGPRRLPEMMRTAGRWVAKLRRMSSELRSQSGIDELIRIEGLEREIRELRSLARFNVVETIMAPAVSAAQQAESSFQEALSTTKASNAALDNKSAKAVAPSPSKSAAATIAAMREREYPRIGCDADDVLPDDATAYAEAASAPDAPAASEASPAAALDRKSA